MGHKIRWASSLRSIYQLAQDRTYCLYSHIDVQESESMNAGIKLKILTHKIVITKMMEQISFSMPMKMHSGLAWSLMRTIACEMAMAIATAISP